LPRKQKDESVNGPDLYEYKNDFLAGLGVPVPSARSSGPTDE
jgi:hypothetical protein